jgi:hypothetical protein
MTIPGSWLSNPNASLMSAIWRKGVMSIYGTSRTALMSGYDYSKADFRKARGNRNSILKRKPALCFGRQIVAYVESQKHFGLRDNHRGRAPRNTDPGGHAAGQMPRYSVYLSVVMELRKPKSLVRSVAYRKSARGINETVDRSTRIDGPSTASSSRD